MKVTTQNDKLAEHAPRRDGAVHLGPPARLPDLSRPTAIASCRTWPARSACARCATATPAPITSTRRKTSPTRISPSMPSKCIVCSRCVRACDEQQGTLALTIQGRGFDSKVSASQAESFLDSECVSCGACVQACPTATLSEKSLIEIGQAEHSVVTTCAYCGVGCSFRAEMRGEEVVRMVPNKDGHANHGHSCVKGRFAIGYATHPDRITKPMIRATHLRSVARSELGGGDRARGLASCGASRRSTAATASAASPRAAAPTRRPTWCRSWCAPASATTTSIPARASAIRRPATA